MLDYKKVFKKRTTRARILRALNFIPDKPMLQLQYRIKTGRKLDLMNPSRFTEKLQWYKLYYRNPVMHQCIDKYLVRRYVADKGLADILVPLIGHYSSIEEVDWSSLPNQFVIKTTHGGGGLSVMLCWAKDSFNIEEAKQKLRFSAGSTVNNGGGREWAYSGLEKGIVVEQLLINRDNPDAGVNDYKFFCYDGEPKYIIVDVDRYIGHKRDFYDCAWNNLHITSDCPAVDRAIQKPDNLDEMLDVARKLSADFPYVRVDLYSVDGKVYFGELTFYPWSGYVQFSPDEWDKKFGEDFELRKYL